MGRVEVRKKQKEMLAKKKKSGNFFTNLFRKTPGKQAPASEKKKTVATPTKKPVKKIAKLKYGMGSGAGMDSGKAKQGPPKPPASLKTKVKPFESKLDSKGNYKGTNIKPTKLQLSRMKKPKKNTMAKATGPEMFKKKKDDGKAPMYEAKGTKVKSPTPKKKPKVYSGSKTSYTVDKSGIVQFKAGGGKMKKSKYMAGGGKTMTPKAKPKTYTGKKKSYTVDKSGVVQFKSMGGKMKKSKYYAGGGMVFTGR